jgi:hypothetical protein
MAGLPPISTVVLPMANGMGILPEAGVAISPATAAGISPISTVGVPAPVMRPSAVGSVILAANGIGLYSKSHEFHSGLILLKPYGLFLLLSVVIAFPLSVSSLTTQF